MCLRDRGLILLKAPVITAPQSIGDMVKEKWISSSLTSGDVAPEASQSLTGHWAMSKTCRVEPTQIAPLIYRFLFLFTHFILFLQ